MKVGDLVTIRPAVASPHLYGVGLVMSVTGERCFVAWPTMPDREPKGCAIQFLELISESR